MSGRRIWRRPFSQEMGAPLTFAREAQVWAGRVHLEATIEALETYEFSRLKGTSLIVREPVGVAALITPWNWPLNQIVCKVAPALAAGCAVVLKPSEIAPISGIVFAEIVDAAGAPGGVFNLLNGTGPDVGQAMAGHPDVDMVSFTGSTRAGIMVAKTAADTVKRVAQELGGKSPNIILRDADFEAAVRAGVAACFSNSGQSCDAPTRMLVPAERHDEALDIAAEVAAGLKVGDPREPGVDLGPVVSQTQFDKIQRLIEAGFGMERGLSPAARDGRRAQSRLLRSPDGLRRRRARHDDRARRSVWAGAGGDGVRGRGRGGADRQRHGLRTGSLCVVVRHRPRARGRRAAARRHGQYQLSGLGHPRPFGGFKQSGNGREYADFGIDDYLELKAVVGYGG